MTTFCDPVNKSHDSRAKSADDPPFPPSYFPLPTTLITRQSSFSPPLIARRLPRAISLQALFRVKNSKRIGQVAVFSSRTRFGTNDDGKKKIEKRRTRNKRTIGFDDLSRATSCNAKYSLPNRFGSLRYARKIISITKIKDREER